MMMAGISFADDAFNPYAGTTTQDFEKGGQFDLNTELGTEKFIVHGNGANLRDKQKLLNTAKVNYFEWIKKKNQIKRKLSNYNKVKERAQLSSAVYNNNNKKIGKYSRIDNSDIKVRIIKTVVKFSRIPKHPLGKDDVFNPYEGTTIQDFEKGGKFDLNTQQGADQFKTHVGKFPVKEDVETEVTVTIPITTISSFEKNDIRCPKNATCTDAFEQPASFHASTYLEDNTKNIIVAFEGSGEAFIDDWVMADAGQLVGTPKQFKFALQYFDKIRKKYPKSKGYTIKLTGHSLGGALAQYVSAQKGVPAITFNANRLFEANLRNLTLKQLSNRKNYEENYKSWSDIVSLLGSYSSYGVSNNHNTIWQCNTGHSIDDLVTCLDSITTELKKKLDENFDFSQYSGISEQEVMAYVLGETHPDYVNKYGNDLLTNLITASGQCSNSAFGSGNCFPTYTDNPAVTDMTNNNNAAQKAGYEQQALAKNTVEFQSSDWVVTTGDPNKHYQIDNHFGSVTAPNNGLIGALNNADMAYTSMQKTVTIPNGVKQVDVSMMANFVTNEYPKYVGSKFNDQALIEIKTGSGNVYQATLYNKKLNSSNFTNVNNLPKPMKSTGGQTGFDHVQKTIPVANGGDLTITVKTVNVGDKAYPSATLVNQTSVK